MNTPAPAASNSNKILIVIGLIAAAGVLIYFLMFSKPKPEAKKNADTPPPLLSPQLALQVQQPGSSVTQTVVAPKPVEEIVQKISASPNVDKYMVGKYGTGYFIKGDGGRTIFYADSGKRITLTSAEYDEINRSGTITPKIVTAR